MPVNLFFVRCKLPHSLAGTLFFYSFPRLHKLSICDWFLLALVGHRAALLLALVD